MNRVVLEKRLTDDARLQIVQGDLTEEQVDAIVNAANRHLAHGGGVAGAIVRRGGRQIQRESDEWVRQHGPVSHADPAYTSGGNLPCKYVIHAVGPVWGQGDEDARLAAAVTGSLRRADDLMLKSIALPAISTGIYGFPMERAAGVILSAVGGYFVETPASGLEQVRLVLYDSSAVGTFVNAWKSQSDLPGQFL